MKYFLILTVTSLLGLAALDAAGPPLVVPADEGRLVDDTQEVLYLGLGRPAILRLHLRSGGKPVVARWEAFMAKFFAYLDRNGSGGLDRSEARMVPTAPQMQQLLSGNIYNYFPNQGTARVEFELLDSDRDGKVTVEEFADFYRKGGAGPVQVVVNAVLGNASTQDPLTNKLFELLDRDKDGKLSKGELDAAETVLIRLDSNDDELISVAELGVNLGVNYTRLGQQARVRSPRLPTGIQANPLVLLPRPDVPRRNAATLEVVRTLIRSRDKDNDNKLTLEESGFPRAFFDKYDTNRDGRLDAIELAKWARGKPDAEFVISLAGPGGAMMPSSTRGGDDMSLTMGNVRLTVVPVNGNAGVANAKDFFLGQLRAVDSMRTGFVARKQLNAQTHYYLLAVFDLADHNGDGRLTEDELKTYLDTVQTANGAQVSLSLNATGQGLFQALDANGDGQLSVRELRQAWSRLARYDADEDGCISRDEFPMQFELNVGHGTNGAFFAGNKVGMMGYAVRPSSGGRGPIWFRKMDRNADGDVSRIEWLGSKADFDRIDTNKDGLISLDEAEAFDATVRTKE